MASHLTSDFWFHAATVEAIANGRMNKTLSLSLSTIFPLEYFIMFMHFFWYITHLIALSHEVVSEPSGLWTTRAQGKCLLMFVCTSKVHLSNNVNSSQT